MMVLFLEGLVEFFLEVDVHAFELHGPFAKLLCLHLKVVHHALKVSILYCDGNEYLVIECLFIELEACITIFMESLPSFILVL